jgi:phage terminase large subunit-like protein
MTGETNDFSVCTTWCVIKADFYLIDVFRGAFALMRRSGDFFARFD